jgi:hypothetical protein
MAIDEILVVALTSYSTRKSTCGNKNAQASIDESVGTGDHEIIQHSSEERATGERGGIRKPMDERGKARSVPSLPKEEGRERVKKKCPVPSTHQLVQTLRTVAGRRLYTSTLPMTSQ